MIDLQATVLSNTEVLGGTTIAISQTSMLSIFESQHNYAEVWDGTHGKAVTPENLLKWNYDDLNFSGRDID